MFTGCPRVGAAARDEVRAIGTGAGGKGTEVCVEGGWGVWETDGWLLCWTAGWAVCVKAGEAVDMTGGAARDEVRRMDWGAAAALDEARVMAGGDALTTGGTVVGGEMCLTGMGAGCGMGMGCMIVGGGA